jgi:hypothetical protein
MLVFFVSLYTAFISVKNEKRHMFELSKSVLQGVSFDEQLFKKELHKLILWLGDNEKDYIRLKTWCYKCYQKQFPKILKESFSEN